MSGLLWIPDPGNFTPLSPPSPLDRPGLTASARIVPVVIHSKASNEFYRIFPCSVEGFLTRSHYHIQNTAFRIWRVVFFAPKAITSLGQGRNLKPDTQRQVLYVLSHQDGFGKCYVQTTPSYTWGDDFPLSSCVRCTWCLRAPSTAPRIKPAVTHGKAMLLTYSDYWESVL